MMVIPKGLRKRGKQFFSKVSEMYDFEDIHDLERLEMAAKTLDELDFAEKQLRADGLYITNRYGNVTEHPAMKTIKDLRLLFVKIIRELGLDLPAPDTHAPRRY
jgi:phage terminase small subunit